MAILNGLYLHVVDESVDRDVDATSHPVEEGLPITDTVKVNALTISLSGKIVDYGNMKASQVLAKIDAWYKAGDLLMYKGRNVASSMQIHSFSTSHPNTNHGGADFSMTLTEVRIAKSSYVPKKTSTAEQETAAKKDTTELKVGDIVVFKGGPVYVSSDATKKAATRNRSTCKVTKIGTASWSIHTVHLISEDGGMVYGWVDLSNIEGVEATSTSGKTNAGTQQTQSSSSSKSTSTSSSSSTSSEKKYPVYHKVKSGDAVYKLCSQYSYLSPAPRISTVMINNPSAFSKPGVATTLKVGAYLLMGYKQ